jgi:uncharacterized protein
VELILRRRVIVLALAATILSGAVYGVTRLQIDTRIRTWFQEGSPEVAAYDLRLAKFGSDDLLGVTFRDENGLMNNHALGSIRRITDELWKVRNIKRVDSLANFPLIRASRLELESPAFAITPAWIAAAGDHWDILVWDRKSWQLRQLVGHEGLVEHLVLSPDRKRLYSGSVDRTVREWDLESGREIRVLRGAPEAVSALQLSPDGKRIYAGSYKSLVVWDSDSGRRLTRVEHGEDYVTRVAISPDGRRVYAASKTIAVFDAEKLERTASWSAHRDFVTALVLSKDGKHLYSSADDGTVIHWDTESGAAKTLLSIEGAYVGCLALSSDEEQVIAGLSDGTLRAIPRAGGHPITTHMHDDWITDLAVGPDGRVYSASRDHDVGVHFPGQGPSTASLRAHRAPVRRVMLDEAGTLFTLGDDGDLYAWDTSRPAIVRRLYRGIPQELPPPVQFGGPATGKVAVHNGFRFPIALRIAGKPHGTVLGSKSIQISGLEIASPKPCSDDSSCGKAEYCDFEADEPICIGRALVEAFVPGTEVRLWAGAGVLSADRTVTIQVPAEDAFSNSEIAVAPPDPRTRVGELVNATSSAERPVIEAALEKLLGSDAKDPAAFLTPKLAESLRDTLPDSFSDELRRLLGRHAQASISPIALPVQPFRLLEEKQILTRGPRPTAKGIFVNEAVDTTVIAATIQTDQEKNPIPLLLTVRKSLEAILEEEKPRSGHDYHLIGDVVQDTLFFEIAQRDIKRLFPFFILAVILILSFWYRRPAGVFLPLTLVLVAITITVGYASLMGATVNNLTVGVPQVVLCCTIGDLNHIFNGYLDRLRHGDDKHTAIVHTMMINFVPCFWTAATTAIGFWSMIIGTDIVPVLQFGWMGGIGAMAAWFGTFTVMPCILSWLPLPKKLGQEESQGAFAARMDRRMVAVAKYVNATAGTLCVIAVIAAAIAVYGLFKSSYDTSPLKAFHEDSAIRRGIRFSEEHIGGPFSIAVMVDTGEQGGVRKVKHLEQIEKLQNYILTTDAVTSVTSLVDIIRSMNRVMTQDLSDQYRIPETDTIASGHYSTYTMSLSAGQEITNLVSSDESTTLIDVRVVDRTSSARMDWGRGIEAWAAQNTPGLKVTITGKSWLYSNTSFHIGEVFLQDVAQAVVAISITLFFLARSWRLGLIALFINLIPLAITVGFTSLRGTVLDLAVLISSTVAMGIVVDDTIHYITKYKWLRESGHTHEETTIELAKEHSKSTISTTLILLGGFVMFVFTDYMINRNFGLTTATMLGVGVFFDLLVGPAFLKFFAPSYPARVAPAHEAAPADQAEKVA